MAGPIEKTNWEGTEICKKLYSQLMVIICLPGDISKTTSYKTRPGNLVDATPPIQALGGKGVLVSELLSN